MPTWACHAERPFANKAPKRDSPRVLRNLGNFYEHNVTPIVTTTYTIHKYSP